MNKDVEILTVKERYDNLTKKEKIKLRDAFLLKFEYQYPTWYQKLNTDNFKKIEIEFLKEQLLATNQNNN